MLEKKERKVTPVTSFEHGKSAILMEKFDINMVLDLCLEKSVTIETIGATFQRFSIVVYCFLIDDSN